jgi:hypothetical protein
MKPRSLLLIVLLAALAGCAIVPLEPYGYGARPHRYHGEHGYRGGHEHRDWR